MPDLLDPITPGELLSEEFLKPMGLSQYRLAKEIGVPAQRIGQIVLGRLLQAGLRRAAAYDGGQARHGGNAQKRAAGDGTGSHLSSLIS